MDGFVRGRVRKLFLRLGLRGHHPHPPAPSPASGRGGAARAFGTILRPARGGDARAAFGEAQLSPIAYRLWPMAYRLLSRVSLRRVPHKPLPSHRSIF
jgi:hypothetical protein